MLIYYSRIKNTLTQKPSFYQKLGFDAHVFYAQKTLASNWVKVLG